MLGGVYLFNMFLVSNCLLTYVMSYSLIYVFILCFVKLRIYFVYLYFSHMRLCVLFSGSGNIQVDSVMLLSTLTTDR